MQISKIQNNNASFNGLTIKKVDIDHMKKFIDPIKNTLENLADKCDIYISGTTIPISQRGNAIIGVPALKITVDPSKLDRTFFKLNRSSSTTTQLPISELEDGETIVKIISKALDGIHRDAFANILHNKF